MGALLSVAMMVYAWQTPSIPVGPMTIDAVAQLAEHNSFAVRIQKTAVEKNRQQVKAAQALLGPVVSGNLGYTRYNSELSAQVGQFTFVEQRIDSETGGF